MILRLLGSCTNARDKPDKSSSNSQPGRQHVLRVTAFVDGVERLSMVTAPLSESVIAVTLASGGRGRIGRAACTSCQELIIVTSSIVTPVPATPKRTAAQKTKGSCTTPGVWMNIARTAGIAGSFPA